MTTEADLEIDETNEDEDGDLSSESPDGERYDRYHPSSSPKEDGGKAQQNKSSHSSRASKESQDKLDKLNDDLQKARNNPVGKSATAAGPDPTKYVGAANKARRGDYTGAAIDAGEQLTKDATKRGIISFFSSPPGMITLAAIIILLILLFIIFLLITIFSGGAHQKNKQNQNKTLTISKTGPSKANVNDRLEYTIKVSETKSASDIIIVDHMPQDTEFISSSWKGEAVDKQKSTITWHAKDNIASSSGALNRTDFTINLVLRATKNNTNLINWAEATTIEARGAGGGAVTGDYVPPSNSNCGGKYQLTSSIRKNFGDPDCNFNKNQLHAMLKQMDPKNANAWFFKIVPCESGYNPNAYAPPSTGTPDNNGAWGLFQMGSSIPPPAGKPPPAEGKNGPNDRGDVNWPIQTENATTYGKKLSDLGAYWSCAR